MGNMKRAAGRKRQMSWGGRNTSLELTPVVLVNILSISQLITVAGHYLASSYQRAKAFKSVKRISRPDM